ncbi:hypothetical protein [Microbulbifer sp. SAOS-129_SWC]|uniref:hypothetical protein n=1 Tax=Microbulbifer sp. SAOS-129_SWC TaxID=3145235 RepID=UPI00321795A5
MSQRIAIRDAVNAALETLTDYHMAEPGTTDEIDAAKLPSIVVGFAVEPVTHEMYGGTERQLDLTVSVVLKNRGDVYAALDQAADDVEGVLGDEKLGGTCDLFLLSQTQFALDQEQPLGEVRLVYSATYSTDPI